MHPRAKTFELGTWLEPEELTYPSGGFKRKARAYVQENSFAPNTRAPYGSFRTVLASIPDTYSTIPARLRTAGLGTVEGFLFVGPSGILTFTPEAESGGNNA